jgi:hypothetical protein
MSKLKKQEKIDVTRLLDMSAGDFEEYIYNGDYCADDLRVLWKYGKEVREFLMEGEE